MCIRHFGFAFLLWFPAELHGQSEVWSCTAPVLDHGLLDPKEETYLHGAKLTYTCNNGRKAADQGRWATSTCNNGTWSPPPQCINENACIPPNIPNGKYTEAQNGWYEEGTTISITCDTGYEHANKDTTATCVTGTWSSGPICQRSSSSSGSSVSEVQTVPIRNCGRKPSTENGDYVESDKMFLKYQCNSFYSLVGPKVVVCYSNNTWSKVPTCKAAFCALNTENHPVLNDVGLKYIKNGETETFKCKKLKWSWVTDHYAAVQCTDGEVQLGECCGWFQRNLDTCT
ncbi:complement factor H-like [Betta splendens]|uniref:Complement factor H-like n=1 Tax=Betta splendens TaxID=158456 RepID=A0A6P7L2W9_BETSP|nr:complement factor H-like [Betta splendens]